jgi:V/A-type H+-transporting ATPase subunit I
MSKVTLIFLRPDAELVMDSINRQGVFHPITKGGEARSDLVGRVHDLMGRLNSLLEQVKALTNGLPTPQAQNYTITAEDWESLINEIESEVASCERYVKEIQESIKREERIRSLFNIWKVFITALKTTVPLSALSFKRLKVLALHRKETRPGTLDLQLPSLLLYVTSNPETLLVICFSEDLEKVGRAAEGVGFAPIPLLEGMPNNLYLISERLFSYEEEVQALSKKNEEMRCSLPSIMSRLLYLDSILSDAYTVLSVKEKVSEKRWMVLEGYVPSRRTTSLVGELQRALKGRIMVFMKEEHSSPQVPVIYRYPRFFRLFESITNLYGVPSYTEINPTPILAITFPLFFGLMFGDLGHGIMLAALGFFLYKYTKSMSKIGVFLIVCGVFGAVVGGVLYGEAFGKHLGYHTPFSPGEDIMSLFKFSLYIGVAQISLGLFLIIVNNLIQKKRSDAFLVNLPKLVLYLLFMYVVFRYGLNLNIWFAGPIFYIIGPIIIMLLGKPVWTFVTHGRREGISALGEAGFEVFDTMIRFVSNTVSYLRIFAMVMAHVQLMNVFYTLGSITGGGVFGSIMSTLLAVLGNIFVVLLEGVLALAQDLRLHFYEWFSKFYEDGGVRFSPFRLKLGIPILKG